MRLLQYIKGDRSGENAHKIEKEMLSNEFLSDAIEGFCGEGNGNEIVRDISDLQREIASRAQTKNNNWLLWGGIAAAVVVVGVLSYFFIFAKDESTSKPVATKVVGKSGYQIANDSKGKPSIATSEVISVGDAESVEGDQTNEIHNDLVVSNETSPEVAVEEKVDIVSEPEMVKPKESTAEQSSDEVVGERKGEQRTGSSKGSQLTIITIAESGQGVGDNNYLTAPRTGIRKYNEYLNRARVLPEPELRGDVTISFRVNQYGRPSSMRIHESPSKEANREVMRLLDSGPEWYPTDENVTITISLK